MSSILENPFVRRVALPITVAQYHALGSEGTIPQDTELLRGIILKKMIKSPQHSWLVQTLAQLLRESLKTGYHVRQEQPLTLADSEPEPDLAIVEGTPDDYRVAHPSTAAVVMEVAISSLEVDREKSQVYAEAGVQEYWLIIPEQRMIEVHSTPRPGGYGEQTSYGQQQTVRLGPFPDVAIDPGQLF